MMPRLSLTPSIRIKTLSKQKIQPIIKQNFNKFVKKENLVVENQKRFRRSSDYMFSRPQQTDEKISFVVQKVLNPININLSNTKHKRLTLTKNQSIQNQIEMDRISFETNLPQLKNSQVQQSYEKPNRKSSIMSKFSKKISLHQSQNRARLQEQRQFSICLRPFIFASTIQMNQKKLKQIISCQKFKQDKVLNIKIDSTKNKNNIETQTYMDYFQQKYLSQYGRLRQLKKRSYQSFQEHFKHLQKLGHQDQLYEQRLLSLEKYFMQVPADERQKRVFDLMGKIRNRQYTLQIVFDDLAKRKQKSNFIDIRKDIEKCSNQFSNLAQSIKTLLKVIQKLFEQDASKTKQKRIIDRIITQINQLHKVSQKSIQAVSDLEKNRLNFDILEKQWRLLQSDNVDRVMLQRNCARKILENAKSAYQLFGSHKNIIIQDEQFMKLSFNQRYQKILNKKCEDCVFIKAKAQLLSNKNKITKPYAKVLNEIVKQPYKNWCFDSQIIDKQTQQQIQKKREQVLRIERETKMFCNKMLNIK